MQIGWISHTQNNITIHTNCPTTHFAYRSMSWPPHKPYAHFIIHYLDICLFDEIHFLLDLIYWFLNSPSFNESFAPSNIVCDYNHYVFFIFASFLNFLAYVSITSMHLISSSYTSSLSFPTTPICENILHTFPTLSWSIFTQDLEFPCNMSNFVVESQHKIEPHKYIS